MAVEGRYGGGRLMRRGGVDERVEGLWWGGGVLDEGGANELPRQRRADF
jgi:hypothetical protein